MHKLRRDSSSQGSEGGSGGRGCRGGSGAGSGSGGGRGGDSKVNTKGRVYVTVIRESSKKRDEVVVLAA